MLGVDPLQAEPEDTNDLKLARDNTSIATTARQLQALLNRKDKPRELNFLLTKRLRERVAQFTPEPSTPSEARLPTPSEDYPTSWHSPTVLRDVVQTFMSQIAEGEHSNPSSVFHSPQSQREGTEQTEEICRPDLDDGMERQPQDGGIQLPQQQLNLDQATLNQIFLQNQRLLEKLSNNLSQKKESKLSNKWNITDIGLFYPDYNGRTMKEGGPAQESDGKTQIFRSVILFIESYQSFAQLYDRNDVKRKLPLCFRGLATDWWTNRVSEDTKTLLLNTDQGFERWESLLKERFAPNKHEAHNELMRVRYGLREASNSTDVESYATNIVRLCKEAGYTDQKQQMEYLWNSFDPLLRGNVRNPTYTTPLTMDDLIRDFRANQETIWALGQLHQPQRRRQNQNLQYRNTNPRPQTITASTPQTYNPRDQYYQSSRNYESRGQITSAAPKTDPKQTSSNTPREDKPAPRTIEGPAVNERKMITANQGNAQRFRRRHFPPTQRAYQAEADNDGSPTESPQETSDAEALHADEQSSGSDDDNYSQTGQDYEASAQWIKTELPQPTPATCRKCRQSFPSRNQLHIHLDEMIAKGHPHSMEERKSKAPKNKTPKSPKSPAPKRPEPVKDTATANFTKVISSAQRTARGPIVHESSTKPKTNQASIFEPSATPKWSFTPIQTDTSLQPVPIRVALCR